MYESLCVLLITMCSAALYAFAFFWVRVVVKIVVGGRFQTSSETESVPRESAAEARTDPDQNSHANVFRASNRA